MTPEEAIRTQVAKREMSPRMQFLKALDKLDGAKDALIHGLVWREGNGIPFRSLKVAANEAQLAADLLRDLAERRDEKDIEP